MNTYKAVFPSPCDLSPEEIRTRTIHRARQLGYVVEDNAWCEVTHHTAATDGWPFLMATIEARIPEGALRSTDAWPPIAHLTRRVRRREAS